MPGTDHTELNRLRREVLELQQAATVGVGLDPSNWTVVEAQSDFPAASGGIIDIPAGIWLINGTVPMSNRIRPAAGAYLLGLFSSRDQLVWSGVSPDPRVILDGASGSNSFSFRNMGFVDPVGNSIFEVSSQLSSFFLRDCSIVGNLGFNISASNIVYFEGVRMANATSGMSFASGGQIDISTCAFVHAPGEATGPLVDFGASVWDRAKMENVTFTPELGQFAISAAGNSNLTPNTGRGTVSNCTFNGDGGQITGGITIDDLQWIFKGNTNLSNSIAVAGSEFTGNLIGTSLIQNEWTLVDATWMIGTDRRFNVATNGVITYEGLNPRYFIIQAELQAFCQNPERECEFAIFHTPAATGTPVLLGIQVPALLGANIDRISLIADVDFKRGDKIDLRCRNLDNSADITVTAAEVIVSAGATGS